MAETLFVRLRGKISGPYDIASLQKLVKRGMLSRIHEISPDRQSWTPASAFQELYPATQSLPELLPEPLPEPKPEVPALDEFASAPSPGGAADAYFYAHDDTIVGPLPMSRLARLAEDGTLKREYLVWREGSETSMPAHQIPALAAGLSLSFREKAEAPKIRLPYIYTRPVQPRRRQTVDEATCVSCCVISAFLMLLLLNLPLGKVNGQVQWWWDALKEPGSGSAAILFFFILFAGISVGIVGVLVSGLVRAWTMIGFSGLSFVMILVLGIDRANQDVGGLFFSLAVLYIAAGLLGLGLFRGKLPQARRGRLFQGIFGGSLLFCILIVAILSLAHSDGLERYRGLNSVAAPSWMILALTTGILSVVAALAAAVLGLCGLLPTYSAAVNGALMGTSTATILLPFLAVFIVAYGTAGYALPASPGMFIFTVFRILAIFGAFLAILSTGLFELFMVSHPDQT